MNQRFLVNKVIALLSFGQTQVVVSFRFDVKTILFVFLRWLESRFEMPVFDFFFKFKDENLCLNWNRVFFFCQDLKVLKVIHNLWSIIDGIIVKNFLEYILVLLREDGDDQPLTLQRKLILKETLMIVHFQH